MNREEKAALIDEIGAEIESSEAIFAVDYRGISVTQAAELRGGLREADATFKIVKNRLTKIAAEKAGATELNELLQGPTALTFVKGDTAAAAKAITSFNKEHEVLTYKGGIMGDTVLDEGRFTAISKLPTRDVLNGQLAGIVASPLVTLTRGLGSMISGLAIALQQVADQGLVGGASAPAAEEAEAAEAPAEEAPAEEAAAEEAPEAEADAPAEESAEEAPAEEAAAEEAPEAEADAPAEAAEADEPAAEAPAEEAEASDEPEDNAEAPADEATDGADENEEAPAAEATDGADAKE